MTGSWNLSFANGSDIATIDTPTVGLVANTPFVADMSLTGSGVTPTFNWTIPTASTHDRVSIVVFDLEDRLPGTNLARQIFNLSLAGSAETFAMPVGVLDENHLYSVSIQLDDTTPTHLTSRSRSFFDFSTKVLDVPGDAPVYLPFVDPNGGPNGQPIYSFDIEVQDGQIVFVDPLVAIGYDYEIGAGDPNFASVLLPDIGDGIFELWLFDVNDIAFDTGLALLAGVEFDFTTQLGAFGVGAEGLARFRILGIETAAGLDPLDVTAFPTGLSFVADGRFTGTMTPLTEDVAEPASLTALTVGLLGLGLLGRRRRLEQRSHGRA